MNAGVNVDFAAAKSRGKNKKSISPVKQNIISMQAGGLANRFSGRKSSVHAHEKEKPPVLVHVIRESQQFRVNLGCQYYCSEYDLCVDLNPQDPRVAKADVYDFLSDKHGMYTLINAKNLLEHLPNVGRFLELCHQALTPHGILKLETDNAEWMFFYVRWFHWLLPKKMYIGAHVNGKFSNEMNDSPHLCLFTAYHLLQLVKLYKFKVLKLHTTKHGAHLYAELTKQATMDFA